MASKEDEQKPTDITGTHHDPERIKAMLDHADEHYILIGGLVSGEIPDGFGMMMSTFRIRPTDKKLVFALEGGEFALSAVAVANIADMAGVSTTGTRETASGRNYSSFVATVARQMLDGTVRTETKSGTMDLRDGSGQIHALRQKALAKQKSAEGDITQKRLHITGLAETKAWARAVKKLLGLRSYTAAELEKPFAVPKLQFTGKTKDPVLREMYARGMMNAALGGIGMIYSQGAPAAPALPAAPPTLLLTGGGDDDEDEAPRQHEAARQEPRSQPAPQERQQRDPGDCFMPGKNKGKVRDASDKDLAYWAERLEKERGNWSEQYAEKNAETLRAITAVIANRRGKTEPAGGMSAADVARARAMDAGDYGGGDDEGPDSDRFS